jgi:AraC family transcriptional regulator
MSATNPMATSRSASASAEGSAEGGIFAPASTDSALWARYAPRMRRVIEHVYDHLDGTLDLNALADIACLSPHHWHRVYHAMHGETLAQTVKRLRLHRAAGHLAQTARPIAEVAKQAGYPSLPSFNRTFKSVYGMPPASYRAGGQHRAFAASVGRTSGDGFEVVVKDLPALPLLAVAHRGSYMAIGRAFDLLYARITTAGLGRPGMRMLALYFDDPAVVPEAELRSMAAVAGCAAAPAGSDLIDVTIAAGPCAVLTYIGPYASMRSAYEWLYGEWLPRSQREPSGEPLVEEYFNNPRDTPPADLRTEICLPLQPP